jgi:hypothetical protein
MVRMFWSTLTPATSPAVARLLVTVENVSTTSPSGASIAAAPPLLLWTVVLNSSTARPWPCPTSAPAADELFWVTVLLVSRSMFPVAITAAGPAPVATLLLNSVWSAWTIDPLTPPTAPRLPVMTARTKSSSIGLPPTAPAPASDTFESRVESVNVIVVKMIAPASDWSTWTAPPSWPAKLLRNVVLLNWLLPPNSSRPSRATAPPPSVAVLSTNVTLFVTRFALSIRTAPPSRMGNSPGSVRFGYV